MFIMYITTQIEKNQGNLAIELVPTKVSYDILINYLVKNDNDVSCCFENSLCDMKESLLGEKV